MPRFRTLDELDVGGKRVIVRCDLNVPIKDGKVTDATRIERSAATLNELLAKGAKVIVLAHFGRPDGKAVPSLSLRPVVEPLAAAVGCPVAFAGHCVGEGALAVVERLQAGEIALLENLRFHAEEEENDPEFARALAALGDLYVNDAFSASHRAHASTDAIAQLLPAYAGPLLMEEVEALVRVLEKPERPTAAIIGGAKVSTKIDVLGHLACKVDRLIIGGAMANTFLLAQGVEIGKSLAEPGHTGTALRIMHAAKERSCEVILPHDFVVAAKLEAGAQARVVAALQTPSDLMILDVGPKTVAHYAQIIAGSRTLLWNGPLGAFEFPPFGEGTFALARQAANLSRTGKLVCVAGGGDTVAALNAAGVANMFSYVSTAGGAFLEWLEGRKLPGIVALTRARS